MLVHRKPVMLTCIFLSDDVCRKHTWRSEDDVTVEYDRQIILVS